jgi:hypothetical protein
MMPATTSVRQKAGNRMARVEVLVIGAAHGQIHYRSHHADLTDGRHPDALAAGLATAHPHAAALTVLHSTSWRYADGTVVLTYAAVLDGRPHPTAQPLPDHGLAHSGDPITPSPPHICPDAVATHAARHLAWLRCHDEVVATALAGMPALWHALDRFTPSPAGNPPWPASVTAQSGPAAARN